MRPRGRLAVAAACRRLPRAERAAGARYFASSPRRAARARRLAARCVLVLAPTTAASVLRHPGDHLQPRPGDRAYYQLSSWTEPPGVPVTRQLAARIHQSKAYRAVVIAGSGMGGNLVLATHVEEIYHDAAENPGTARVTLTAEMVDTKRRMLVDRRRFTASVPVPSHDAPGAVAGCRQALGLVIDQVVAWTGELATP